MIVTNFYLDVLESNSENTAVSRYLQYLKDFVINYLI